MDGNWQRARRRRPGERLLTLAVAIVLDRAFGEPPPAFHPVVGLGNLATALEPRARARSGLHELAHGCGLAAAIVGMAVGWGALAEQLVDRLPRVPRLLARAALLKPAFAVRELLAAGERVRDLLERGDVATARAALRDLVSRDRAALDAPLIAAAAVESLAENASDSIVAPGLAYLTAGLPGAYGYRAANTLDAMVGYRGHYERLGKAAARLDDLLNLLPARLTAALIVLGAALTGDDPDAALVVARRDHGATASPNAGWPMSAMAGALGVQLEKPGHYRLGDPRRPVEAADVDRAGRIVERIVEGIGVVLVVAGGALAARHRSGDAP